MSGLAALAAMMLPCLAVAQDTEAAKPNIVIILIDDAALMDLGVYGGEAKTPHIDALAARGAMFTQYRTSPLCSPTRAMLLTGMDNHLTGVATIPEVLPAEHKGKPGYIMALEPGVLTLADRLGAMGYRTLMSGKWHLGETAEEMPNNHGFDHSFALAASGADNWDDKSYMPYYKDAPWWEDGVETSLPDDFYSSEFIVDKMIEYIEATEADAPFFAYLPFQAIHIPLQAPQEFIDRYDGVYDDGWDVLRTARHQRAQELGLIKPGAALAPMNSRARPWDSLSAEDQEIYAARMGLNAAMMEAMDHHVGRFVDYLKDQGAYEDTIFVVASDNGPEPNRGDVDPRLTAWQRLNGYHLGLEGLGQPGSWGFIGPEWANAAASPGALYKFYATEGGIRAPLIMAGPEIPPSVIGSPAMVTDIAPTLLEWVDAPPPPTDARPMTGRSLRPVLTGEAESVYGADDIRAIEVSGNTALYKGDYKITRSMPPVGTGAWQLYNMAIDPGETVDLSEAEPEIRADLVAAYADYAAEMGVLEMPEGYNSRAAVMDNATARMLKHYRGWLIGLAVIALFLLGLIVFGIRWAWRRLSAR
ncbi:MAG: arylsulfatase [Pseudomonadota bacterium]